MPGKGKITRKEIVEDKVLSVGKDYAKSLQPAIDANQKWLGTFEPIKIAALEYAAIEKQFKVSESRKEFLKIKQEEETLRKKAADALKAEQNSLIALQKVQTEKLRQDKLVLDNEKKKELATKRNTKLTIEERVQAQANNKIQREKAKVTLGLIGPYQKLSNKLDKARLEAKDLGVQFGETSKQFKKAQAEVLKLDSRLKRLDVALGQSQRFVGQYALSLKGLRGIFLNLTSALGFTGGLFAFVTVMRNSFGIIRGFSKEMANLRAITKSNGEELEVLAKQLGETTVFTAGEAAKAMSLLGMAGFNTNQILKATPAVLDLAAAGGIGLAAAADIASNVLSGFGKRAEQTGVVVDILAKTATSTNTTILTLGESFKEIAPTAQNLKIPIEEIAASVGLLGNSGIKGTDATSSLNTALNRLSKPTKKMQRKMRELNVEFFDANGQFIGITNTVKLLNERFVGLTDKQKAAAIATIFGNNANKQMTSLLNGQTTAIINNEEVILKGADALNHLTIEYENASGAAKEMADTQLDSLDGAIRLITSAWEGYILGVDGSTGASETLKEGIKFLAQNLEKIISVIANAVKIWLIYKGLLIASNTITKAYRLSTIALAGAKALLTGNTKRSTAALKVFKAQLTSTGIGALVVLLGTLATSFSSFGKTVSETAKETQKTAKEFLNQKEQTTNLNSELNKLSERYEVLTRKSKDNKEGTKLNKSEQVELDRIIQDIAKHVPDAVTQIDKYGNALGVNADKVRAFTEEAKQRDEALQTELIKQTTQDIKDLNFQLDELRNINNRVNDSNIELEQGTFAVRDGVLKTSNSIGVLVNASRNESIQLRKTAKELDNKLKISEELLLNLKGELSAKQKLAIEEKNKADQSKKEAKDKLENEQKQLENEKESEKLRKSRAKLEQKLAKDAVDLAKFVVKERINIQKEIFNSEEESFENRKNALQESLSLELELAKLTAKGKFDIEKGFSDKEIEALITKSKVSKDILKKVGDEELLIIAEFQAKKNQIQKGKEKGNDDLDLIKIKSDLEKQKAIKQKALNDELIQENEAFNKREGIYADFEQATENRERRIAEIKKRYALEALNTQVKAVEELLLNEDLSVEKRAEFEKKLSGIKLEISNLNTENFIDNNEEEVLSTKEKVDQIVDISSQLTAALGELANSIFEARIEKIDQEISKNDEKFEKLLENENLSDTQRKALEKKQEKEREALEKKKRKEQRKQAILNKALALVDVGVATALGIMQSYAQLGPIAGNFGAALVGVLGAVQTAAIIAKPIPQYAKGTEYHPGGLALVGEERAEVITEPNKAPYVVDSPTILDLPEGTSVTPSLAEYKELMRASILTSIDIENKKLNDFQTKQAFDNNNKALLAETKLTRKAIEKMKTNVVVQQAAPVDFEHELFRLTNSNWSA